MPDFSAYTGGEFVKWIGMAERYDVVAALCSLNDADRRRFSKEVAAAHKAIRSEMSRERWRYDLALVGVCGWTEVKRMHNVFFIWANRENDLDNDLIRILKARRPDWIDKLVENEFEQDWPRWLLVRRLVRDGICAKPSTDAYISHMIRSRLGEMGQQNGSLSARLLDDPALLEDEIWRIFEIDPAQGAMFSYDEALWSSQDGRYSWGQTLVQLAADGKIDRARLLAATHDTLRRGIQLKDTGFHLRLIDRLEMTAEERVRLRDVYLDLLGHRVDAVVRFALGECETLLKDEQIGASAILDRITHALQREKKGPTETALKLIRRIAKKDPALAPQASRAALEALRHPVADIHEKALDLIEELGAPDELAQYVEDIAPSQKERAKKLATTEAIEQPRAEERGPRAAFVAREVIPIADFTEMVDVMLAVIEGRDDPIDVERALDGFSRLAAAPPPDDRDRTAALLKRSLNPADNGFSIWSGVAEQVMRLVVIWLNGSSKKTAADDRPEGFLQHRVDEIIRRVVERKAMPMLALPTNGARIDPRVLVTRVQAYVDSKIPAGDHDLSQALLRIAPEHRSEALAAAASLPGQEGGIVRYALGGDDRPSHSWFRTPKWPLWAAASRARSPFESDPNLANTPAALLPFGASPVSYRWAVRTNKTWRNSEYVIDVEASPQSEPRSDWPLSLFHNPAHRWIFGSTADIRHRQTIWPADPTPAMIEGVYSMVDRMFRPASTMTPTAVYLEPLLDPAVRLTELSELAIALALIAKDADARTMATDVALALVADGRLRGEELGWIYARLQKVEGFLKLGRIADAVSAIAPASATHQNACARLLEEVLVEVESPAPKDIHHLLSPYREVLAALGRAADPRLQPLLASIGGSGKTAKLAKALLASAATLSP